VLAQRFALLLGRTPLAYVAQLRLQRAAQLLETSDRSVIHVATEIGYESEAAFNRAFKRSFGVPPARYRRQRRGAENSGSTA
jgi:transcriptional regulator GlxA family with amidase domain